VTELARLAEMSETERELRRFGFRLIAGTDEVGRGCLAGPVVAAAVILDGDFSVLGVKDSKVLQPAARQAVCGVILRRSLSCAVAVVEPETIDRINILRASKLAMRRAVEQLAVRPEIVVTDAIPIEELDMPQLPIISGDSRAVSVAAASIVAKVYRDLLMDSYHGRYPEYDFAHNRGYATENHRRVLTERGRSPIHRRSFEHRDAETLFD
jgi:ribonuclease HII